MRLVPIHRSAVTHPGRSPYAAILNLALGLGFIAALVSPGAGHAAEGVRVGNGNATILPPSVRPGELLLGELNCVACHAAAPEVAGRLDSARGPNLGSLGGTFTPQWLRRWLASPETVQPGTSMPNCLSGVPAEQRTDAVEDLTHYLVSLRPAPSGAGSASDPRRQSEGEKLYHTTGCVACHAPEQRPGTMSVEAFEPVRAASVPLGALAQKYTVADLAAFLRDPLKFRPAGRMPSLGLSGDEALNLALYLLREQAVAATNTPPGTVTGLEYEYFEGEFGGRADFSGRTPKASGSVPEPSLSVRQRDSNFGLRFFGQIAVETPGTYTFWTETDDGSRVLVDGREIVNNDGNHPAVHKEGSVSLTAGRHAFEVRYTQDGGGMEFRLGWSGPGLPRQSISAASLLRPGWPLVPLGEAPFTVDPNRARSGRDWFAKLNCAACHQAGDPSGSPVAAPAAPALAQLAARTQYGCLSEVPSPKVPHYALSPAQRNALRTTLGRLEELQQPLSSGHQVAVTLAKLNCLACHERDGNGGPEASGRSEWFTVVGEADLGEEGRLPPRLTGVGVKLKPEWLRRQLQEGVKVRPYMATRMPAWSPVHVASLTTALPAADRRENVAVEPPITPIDAKTGWKLAGRDGLNCIACHTFTTFGSAGIPALALDRMAERLQWDWFLRYLPEPSGLRPGTRMPSFWPEGKSVNTELAHGDLSAQIRGLWAWLQQGAKAEVPVGLVRGRREIEVGREPVLYRNFIQGAGPRAIGVGYPEHVNLAFDAQDLRLALIWQGAFIDGARHATDRGEGYEPPLGDHRIGFPAGPGCAFLAEANAAWPEPKGRPVGQKFLGYDLDSARRPVFRYQVGSVTLSDALVPRAGALDQTFVRTLRTTGSAAEPLWLRVARGAVRPLPDGRYEIGGAEGMVVKASSAAFHVVGEELRVRVPVPGELVLEFTW